MPIAADERAEDLGRQLAQQIVEARTGPHISIPASFMTGRTSTAV